MKKIFSLVFVSFFIFSWAQETKKVLFVGNSYTAYNNLPNLVQSLAQANGDTLIKDQNTPGGYTFNAHSTNATTLSKIALDDWDYVVLQAQSQEPSFSPSQVASQTKPYAKILCDSVYANNICSKALFYMTWGRENGDQSNCANYSPICTYSGMQQRLRESYLEMADENQASVAPVGMAWKTVREDFPSIDLYNPDESHPSLNGSYLAACVFYASIFHKTVVGNSFTSSLDSLTAYRLQSIASATVLDSLDVWSIDTSAILPTIIDSFISSCDSVLVNGNWFANDTLFSDTNIIANPCNIEITNYNIEINSSEAEIVSFNQIIILAGNSRSVNLQIEAQNYDSLILKKASEVVAVFYPSQNSLIEYEYECQAGEDQVLFTLIAIDSVCYDTSSVNLLTYCGSTAIEDLSWSQWKIFPNPSNAYIDIISSENNKFSYTLIDLSGREVVEKTKESRINIKSLEKGIYFVVVFDINGNAIGQKKIIKN